jgi:GNAT superfamily N-acetyltransferase
VTNDQKSLLAEMSRQTFFDTFSPYNSEEDMKLFMENQFTREQLEAEPDLPDNYFFIAWLKEEPMGYMRLRYWEKAPYDVLPNESSLEITRLYANKNAIGTGIGKAMMQFALDFGKTKNVNWAWLGVWEKNERAIQFYEKWGFEQKGAHDFLLGKDLQTDWLMVKDLRELVKF